jgi:hypothetical protein
MKGVKMNRLFVAVLVAAVLTGSAPAASVFAGEGVPTSAAAAFEGCWRIAADPDATAERGGRHEFQEYLVIESGLVTPVELSKLGFEAAAATFANDVNGNATWTVTLTSTSQGTVTLSCTKTSSTTISGTLVWERNGVVTRYAYTGKEYNAAS